MDTKTHIAVLLHRVNPFSIYPPFMDKAEKLVASCAARGVDYYATGGFRSWDEQQRIFDQGRGLPCDSCKKSGTKCDHIITKAPPGWSPHNYGIAIDFCKDDKPDKAGLQPDWNPAEYEVLAEEAEKLGLDAGLRWTGFRDPPHIQLPMNKHGIRWTTLIALRQSGMSACWRYFDTFKW